MLDVSWEKGDDGHVWLIMTSYDTTGPSVVRVLALPPVRLLIDRIEGLLAARARCAWRYDRTYEKYDTACGHAWYFNEGTVYENGVCYCPYCGGTVLTDADKE